MSKEKEPKYFTVFSQATIGYQEFKRVYVLENDFRSLVEIKRKLPKLFNNCTAFIADDTIWVVRHVLCKRLTKELKSQGVQKMMIVHNDIAINAEDICCCCKNMVREYVGECKEKSFAFTTKNRRSFFLKEDFKEYKKINEIHVLNAAVSMYELRPEAKIAKRLAMDVAKGFESKRSKESIFKPSTRPLAMQMSLQKYEEVCHGGKRKKLNFG
jgi:hypothetical protein